VQKAEDGAVPDNSKATEERVAEVRQAMECVSLCCWLSFFFVCFGFFSFFVLLVLDSSALCFVGCGCACACFISFADMQAKVGTGVKDRLGAWTQKIDKEDQAVTDEKAKAERLAEVGQQSDGY
jgi:hypothetical protein